MRRPWNALLLAVAGVALFMLVAGEQTRPAEAGGKTQYYVSLGDSLSVGMQPNAQGVLVATDEGYADQLYRLLRPRFNDLRHAQFGCSGETTTTMIEGGKCAYQQGSQLAEAVAFLRANAGSIAFVTLDIGANDIDSCAPDGTPDPMCISAGFANTERGVPMILSAVRDAAGPGVPVYAMNLYNPLLGNWLRGESGQALARASDQVLTQFNALLARLYAASGAVLVDIATPFSASDFTTMETLPNGTRVSLNVACTCQWTWMCAPPPVGPNIHANATGYGVIARAFEQVIAASLP